MATQSDKISLTHPQASDVIEFFRSQPRQNHRSPNPTPTVDECQAVDDAFNFLHGIVLTDDSNLEVIRGRVDFFEMVLADDYPQVAEEFRMHCDALFAC
jgi:hypothetical protein